MTRYIESGEFIKYKIIKHRMGMQHKDNFVYKIHGAKENVKHRGWIHKIYS